MKELIRKILAVAALLATSISVNAEDVVILRTGEHVYGKLRRMTVTTVSFESRKTMFEYPLKDVYAVKSDSRGDIFYNMKGERISRPANNEGRGADRIYLIDGEEIIGWKTAISGKTVSYQDSRETKKNRPGVVEIPVEKVFMINYFDGTKEIVNDITTMIEEKKFCPGLTLRAALKTASGGGYDVARYYDSAGYFFDTAVSKRFRLFHPDIYLQAALSGGFLCWQTGTGRQNDAVMCGFLLGFEWKGLRIRETIGGYAGWESSSCVDKELAHDRPLSLKTDVRYSIKNWELIFRYQHGLADYPYNQFQLGLGYHIDILKKREKK